jgi:flagellar motor protein MotB
VAKAKCKCKKTECEECPEWIFTFADLVMLMMGFFVILWVLKPPAGKDGEPPKALDVDTVVKFREAFGWVPNPNSDDPIDVHALKLQGVFRTPPNNETTGGKTTREKEGKRGVEPDVESIRPSKQVGQGGKVLFAPGDATLSPASRQGLDEIAKLIEGHTNVLIVKGHSSPDDYPEDGGTDSARMSLSIARAQAAADYLASKGVARNTLRVQGCGTYEPVVPRAYTAPERTLNRRVEVYATGTLVQELQDSPKVTPSEAPAAAEKEAGH